VLKNLWNQTKRAAEKTIRAYRLTPEPVRMSVGLMLFVTLLLGGINQPPLGEKFMQAIRHAPTPLAPIQALLPTGGTGR
jgi:hypothetical protein